MHTFKRGSVIKYLLIQSIMSILLSYKGILHIFLITIQNCTLFISLKFYTGGLAINLHCNPDLFFFFNMQFYL